MIIFIIKNGYLHGDGQLGAEIGKNFDYNLKYWKKFENLKTGKAK